MEHVWTLFDCHTARRSRHNAAQVWVRSYTHHDLDILATMARQTAEPLTAAVLMERNMQRSQTVDEFFQRLSWGGPDLTFNGHVAQFLLADAERMAEVVMYAHALVIETQKLGRPVQAQDILRLMPGGLPTEEFKREVWERQKIMQRAPGGGAANGLDMREEWTKPPRYHHNPERVEEFATAVQRLLSHADPLPSGRVTGVRGYQIGTEEFARASNALIALERKP